MFESRSLILGVLAIRSSFERDREQHIEGLLESVPDSVQWWIGPERTWRIRAFALDRELHVTSFDARPAIARGIARQVLERSYSNVIARTVELEFIDSTDVVGTEAALRAAGLGGSLELCAPGFGYWTPDGLAYRVQMPPS